MAVTKDNNIIRMTADDDTYGNVGMGRLRIKGVRLVGGSDASTALIKATNTDGHVLMSLKAPANEADESQICFFVDAGVIHLDLTGTGAEVFLYLE